MSLAASPRLPCVSPQYKLSMTTMVLIKKSVCLLSGQTGKMEQKAFELKLQPFPSAEELTQVSSQKLSGNKIFLWEHSIFIFPSLGTI